MRKGRQTEERRTSWGAAKSLDILRFLGHRTNSAPASVIAASCDVPRSSTYDLLNLLTSRGFVTHRRDEHAWTLGNASFELSAGAPLFAHGLAVLKAFGAASGGLTLRLTSQQIASRVGISRAAVECVLPHLVESDFLHPNNDDTYSLGLELVSLASRVAWNERLCSATRTQLLRLRGATHEAANLIVAYYDHAVFVEQVESSYARRDAGWVGRRVPLVGTAFGAAFKDRGTVYTQVDCMEMGVTAVVCGIDVSMRDVGIGGQPSDVAAHDAAIGITGPGWRIEEFGLARAKRIVEAVALELTLNLGDGHVRP